MSDKKRKVPKLRFPGFTDAWEQRKLGEVGSLLKETVYPSKHPDKLYHEYSMPNYDDWKTPKVVKGNSMLSNRIKIKGNVLLINKLNVHQRRIWNVQTSFEDSVASGEFLPYISEEVNLEMLSQVLLSDSSTLDLISLSSGSSNSQKRITPEEFMKYNVMFPTDIKEQNMIAKLLNSIDKHISLHQRKLDNVKMLKKSLLQKLFPKDGEKTPELRFPGFTDAWEQRKLGEVVGVNSGRDYKHLESGNFPVYGTGGYMLSVSEALSYTEDAIGIGRKGTIDKPFILKAPFWTVDTLFYCIPKGENDLEFVFSLFQNITWKKLDESTGVPSLSKQLIDNVRVTIPSEKEQAQLGYIFESINTLISLHQRKLDHLKELKKGLLQQMFV